MKFSILICVLMAVGCGGSDVQITTSLGPTTETEGYVAAFYDGPPAAAAYIVTGRGFKDFTVTEPESLMAGEVLQVGDAVRLKIARLYTFGFLDGVCHSITYGDYQVLHIAVAKRKLNVGTQTN